MRKLRKKICSLIMTLLINGCGPFPETESFENKVYTLSPILHFTIDVEDDGVKAAGDMTVNLACDNVYGSSVGDWTKNNVTLSSGGSISIISGKACRVTLLNYSDGPRVYSAISSSLVISISSTGVVTQTSSLQYTSGGVTPVLVWFSAAQGATTNSITINYSPNAVTALSSPSSTINLTSSTVNLNVAMIAAPTVSAVTITETFSATFSYTLTATVSGATSCKYIDNSSATYTPTSWISVNSAFTAAGATNCPVLTSGSATTGNWNSRWLAGVKTLVMWANLVGGINAYTAANIGP